MADSPAAVLNAANAAITQGDIEGFLVHCTDDTDWTFVGEQRLQGKAAVRQYMKDTYLTPPKFDVHELIENPDNVIALGEITLRDEQGTEVHYDYCDVWTLRAGKLATLRAYVVKTG